MGLIQKNSVYLNKTAYNNWLYRLADHDFSSVLILMPKNIRDKVVSFGKKNIKEFDIYKDEDTKGLETETHVTVKYGLHTTNSEDVKEIIETFPQFEITFDKVSKFSSHNKFDVIKIDVLSKELHKLNNLVSKELKHSDKYPIYKPHCTIAYVKKGTCKDIIGNDEFQSTNLLVTCVYFSDKSDSRTKINLKQTND